ncbi:MAG TPA: FdtA/QdtA family cupin domain-containing protein [Bacteroidia bacterium]
MVETIKKPKLIEFPKIGSSPLGYISVAEIAAVGFNINRVFWTYYTPEEIIRGRHAHYELEQILIAASGKLVVGTECFDSDPETFELSSPNVGLYIPPYCWHDMQFSHSSVLLSLSSIEYRESDYIRDYQQFKKMKSDYGKK